MNAIRNWFTPATREKIYTAIAALAPILVTAGVILPGQVEPIMVIVAAGLQVLGGLLALVNLKPTDAARWFGTVGRGIIYGGAVTVAGAVVALGIVTQDWATTALTYVSFGLTALAAVLAVVTPKEVQVDISEIPLPVKAVVVEDAIVETNDITVESVEAGAVTAENIQVGTIAVTQVDTDTLPGEHTGDGRDL